MLTGRYVSRLGSTSAVVSDLASSCGCLQVHFGKQAGSKTSFKFPLLNRPLSEPLMSSYLEKISRLSLQSINVWVLLARSAIRQLQLTSQFWWTRKFTNLVNDATSASAYMSNTSNASEGLRERVDHAPGHVPRESQSSNYHIWSRMEYNVFIRLFLHSFNMPTGNGHCRTRYNISVIACKNSICWLICSGITCM